MAVRLDKNLRATIDKVVASYNRKINYYGKKGYRNLPSKTSFKEIISLGSRKLINKELKSMMNLNSKTVKNIIVGGNLITSYENEKIGTRLSRSKRALKTRIKRLANIEYKKFGEKAGFTMGDKVVLEDMYSSLDRGQIKSDKLISALRKYERLNKISAKDFFSMSDKEKESVLSLLNRVDNPYINPDLKKNYLEALTDLGYAYGYDSKKMAEIEAKLKNLSSEEFEKIFTEDLGVRKILSYYDIMKINVGSGVLPDNKRDVMEIYDNLYENLDIIIGKNA